MLRAAILLTLLALAACQDNLDNPTDPLVQGEDASVPDVGPEEDAPAPTPDVRPPDDPPQAPEGPQGARLDRVRGVLDLRLFSEHAEHIEVWLYEAPERAPEAMRVELIHEPGTPMWSAAVPIDTLPEALRQAPIYYGVRLWGPNWRHSPAWIPGSLEGFVADVDDRGNRFNPNKLLLDPYALEMSHDPHTPEHDDGRLYASGEHRQQDSGPLAPKGIVFELEEVESRPEKPTRAFKDEVIYEVHLRGLTMQDPGTPEHARGTYLGAGLKAPYLKDLGVTAVEFLPLHETQNERNDLEESTHGDNYWGYSTLSFFAPDRRYASDKSPGGPTRELRQMVDAFHAEGIKVYLDVVYNHTGEGNPWDESGQTATLLSWRGIDNRSYYQLNGAAGYWNNNGVSANTRATHPQVRRLILDSLRYWQEVIGVDGYRFDLASVLGNGCEGACFAFDRDNPDGTLVRAVRELPARPAAGGPGVDLIAEPWGIGPGTYQVGNFPQGWAEWNGQYRDTLRDAQNRLDITDTPPGKLALRLHGSSDLYRDDGRLPWHSVNFLVAHDGFTLADLYSCSEKVNDQAWPYGPSNGGTDDNRAFDYRGDPTRQRQAARTGLALLMLSSGVPMITGGDELLRSLRCNNNPYNLDSPANWLDWPAERPSFFRFARKLMRFRGQHPALRPAAFTEGVDRDNDGVKDITWLTPEGTEPDAAYMASPQALFLAFRLDGDELGDEAHSLYVAYNRSNSDLRAHLPNLSDGRVWVRAMDTAAWMEGLDNFHDPGDEQAVPGLIYDMAPRSVLLLIER